jgi:hypothetical protein
MCRIEFGPTSGMGKCGGVMMSRCRWTARDQSGDINPCRGKGGKEKDEEGKWRRVNKKENAGRKKR